MYPVNSGITDETTSHSTKRGETCAKWLVTDKGERNYEYQKNLYNLTIPGKRKRSVCRNAREPGVRLRCRAAKTTPGFTPSAQRGQGFLTKEWGVSQKMANCTTCHGKNLKADGKHVVTEKRIAPFSPAANPERFTSLSKVEKWFKRNCTEVVGRECTAAEKADFIQFVTQGG